MLKFHLIESFGEIVNNESRFDKELAVEKLYDNDSSTLPSSILITAQRMDNVKENVETIQFKLLPACAKELIAVLQNFVDECE